MSGDVGLCSIVGCCKPSYVRGWCNAHYLRWKRHGDPLAGGIPNGEAVRWLTEVALNHVDPGPCLIWPYARSDSGYGKIWIDSKLQVVPRIVCERRHGPAPTRKHEAAHSCGKGHEGCCNPWHLDWKTPKQNHADKALHNTQQRGERHGQAKLTEPDVHEIRRLLAAGTKITAIAQRFQVSHSVISNISSGKAWGWLGEEP